MQFWNFLRILRKGKLVNPFLTKLFKSPKMSCYHIKTNILAWNQFPFLAVPSQLYRWPCHWLSNSLYSTYWLTLITFPTQQFPHSLPPLIKERHGTGFAIIAVFSFCQMAKPLTSIQTVDGSWQNDCWRGNNRNAKLKTTNKHRLVQTSSLLTSKVWRGAFSS